MNKTIFWLFEDVINRAWKEEKAFSKAIFKMKAKKTDSLCQGISRNIHHKITGCFPNNHMLEIEIKEKTHIIVYVNYNLEAFILDGTIKQFLPKESRTVFSAHDYPFKKQLQTAKKRYS